MNKRAVSGFLLGALLLAGCQNAGDVAQTTAIYASASETVAGATASEMTAGQTASAQTTASETVAETTASETVAETTAALPTTAEIAAVPPSETASSLLETALPPSQNDYDLREGAQNQEETILIAAAVSLKYSFDEELIPMFEARNPNIRVEATYDSSGKLQTQIEEGLEADVFMSAAMKQINALKDEKLIDEADIIELLENKIVLIVPADVQNQITSFENIVKADSIAIGDPESVPAGQYAKEVLENLGLWEEVSVKASLGTNVTEVLNWVAEGSADVGIVYATDAAALLQKVKIVGEAPEGSLKTKIIYPVAVVSGSVHKEAAHKFVEFLQSEPAIEIFEKYGFSKN